MVLRMRRTLPRPYRASGTGATPAPSATLALPSPATRRSQRAWAAEPCRSSLGLTRMVWRRNQPTEAASSWVQQAARRTLQGGARVGTVRTVRAVAAGGRGLHWRPDLSPSSRPSAMRRCASSGRARMPNAGRVGAGMFAGGSLRLCKTNGNLFGLRWKDLVESHGRTANLPRSGTTT